MSTSGLHMHMLAGAHIYTSTQELEQQEDAVVRSKDKAMGPF